ncbi:hypothetical protein [Cohnella sp.]|uniref:hypothetical protein n=1 Tax=Cohnella sp. TaxID=1883426 RepID=UPI003563B1BA
MKIKWLHQYIESNFADGLCALEKFECFQEEFNGFQYRIYVEKQEFDEGNTSLITAVLGIYDIEFEQEHEPSIFELPSTLINRINDLTQNLYF